MVEKFHCMALRMSERTGRDERNEKMAGVSNWRSSLKVFFGASNSSTTSEMDEEITSRPRNADLRAKRPQSVQNVNEIMDTQRDSGSDKKLHTYLLRSKSKTSFHKETPHKSLAGSLSLEDSNVVLRKWTQDPSQELLPDPSQDRTNSMDTIKEQGKAVKSVAPNCVQCQQQLVRLMSLTTEDSEDDEDDNQDEEDETDDQSQQQRQGHNEIRIICDEHTKSALTLKAENDDNGSNHHSQNDISVHSRLAKLFSDDLQKLVQVACSDDFEDDVDEKKKVIHHLVDVQLKALRTAVTINSHFLILSSLVDPPNPSPAEDIQNSPS